MEKIVFDYSKLRGKIIEKTGSQKAFAEALGINVATLTSKMKGHTQFTQREICRSIDILGIDPGEVALYFFAQ